MKNRTTIIILLALALAIPAFTQVSAQAKEPWTAAQLLAPADLAKTINNPKAAQPYIYCIGPSSVVKGSIYIGPTREEANLNAFKTQLEKLPKDANIVIYCGCCPFDRCPNVRPAFELLNKMQFKNQKLLDLPHNVKVDWIDKGYPVVED